MISYSQNTGQIFDDVLGGHNDYVIIKNNYLVYMVEMYLDMIHNVGIDFVQVIICQSLA